MKKFIAVAMIALLAVTSVFAGFSGEFSADYTADFAGKAYGFNNGAGFKMTFDATTGSTANENDVYAKLAGSFAVNDVKDDGFLSAGFELTEASINGADWSIDLTGAAGVGNYANGFAARTYGNKAAKPGLTQGVKTTNGITGTYLDYTAAVGMNFAPASVGYVLYKAGVDAVEGDAVQPTFVLKNGEFVLDGGTTAVAGKDDRYIFVATPETKEISGSFALPEYKFIDDALTVTGSLGAFATSTKNVDLGFGAKVAYADDNFSASAAADVVLNIADEFEGNVDVLVNVAYAPVDVALYYATDATAKVNNAPKQSWENLLDLQVATDLAAFDIPVSFTITGTDLINDGRGFDAAVDASFAGVTLGVNGGYNFGKKAWNAGLNAEYSLENIATFSAGFGMKGTDEVSEVSLSIGAVNTTLIENAELALSYASENFLDEEKAAGAITASVGIAF